MTVTSTSAETIDEVVDQLTEIVEWSHTANSPLGYFAALYRKVTIKVGEGIADGIFDDGDRMERLDMIFATRYLHTVEAHRAGTPLRAGSHIRVSDPRGDHPSRGRERSPWPPAAAKRYEARGPARRAGCRRRRASGC